MATALNAPPVNFVSNTNIVSNTTTDIYIVPSGRFAKIYIARFSQEASATGNTFLRLIAGNRTIAIASFSELGAVDYVDASAQGERLRKLSQMTFGPGDKIQVQSTSSLHTAITVYRVIEYNQP